MEEASMKPSERDNEGPSVLIAPEPEEEVELELTAEEEISPPIEEVAEPISRPARKRRSFWVRLLYLIIFLALLTCALLIYATLQREGREERFTTRIEALEDRVQALEERIKSLEEERRP